MNMERMINMVMRIFMRQVIGKGVNGALKLMSGRKKKPRDDDPDQLIRK